MRVFAVCVLLFTMALVSACSHDDACFASPTDSGVGGGPVVQQPSGGAFGDAPDPKPQGSGGVEELDGERCTWGCRCVGVYGSLAHPYPPTGDGSELALYHCAYDESRSYTSCTELDTALRESCVREHKTARPRPGWTYDTMASLPQWPCKEWFRK